MAKQDNVSHETHKPEYPRDETYISHIVSDPSDETRNQRTWEQSHSSQVTKGSGYQATHKRDHEANSTQNNQPIRIKTTRSYRDRTQRKSIQVRRSQTATIGQERSTPARTEQLLSSLFHITLIALHSQLKPIKHCIGNPDQ
ncbi:hypothetical protein PGT21_004869 [Puccinia graminis f. sp. tritici]|uniref:Uncharacterized protein n=1 Tax=Puccinia graminis f. sp. tritici TaxID=56615 RepID=A0A5B0MC66_PUCGR|nr:hypothetical protein PGT21_004869 [Puccinia graminis f. sp. tritici]